jgi:hypothetical protein
MAEINSLYPKYPNSAKLISEHPSPKDTFLFDRLENIDDPFWAELEYFLLNSERLGDTREVLRKLCSEAPLCLEIDKAWERQRDFRSAQFEITAVFLIEKYFGGKVALIPESHTPTPDFEVELNQGRFTVEAKAQSGQQHGDKHPRHNGSIMFTPKGESDLRSWLFEEKISSRSGKPMVPQVLAAEKKAADVLVCQTDYVKTQDSLTRQISILCPGSKLVERMSLPASQREPMDAIFFQATYPYDLQPTRLKEIWLCYLGSSRYRLVVLSFAEAILINHLKCRR